MAHQDFDVEGEESAALAAPASAPPLGAPARSYPAFDPVLDEDLFHFDEAGPRTEAKAPGEYISRNEVLAIGQVPEPAIEEPEASRSAANEEAGVEEMLDRVAGRVAAHSASMPSSAVLASRGGFLASRWALVALATTSVVQAALVFFAWRASDTFRDAVQGARKELVQNRSVEPSSAAPSHATQEVRSEGTSASEPTVQAVDEWVAGLDSPTEITFRIAEREIEEGDYTAARRRLYALLALQDDGVLTPDRIADARYWIAEAWARESASLADPKEEH